jgi:hypothetical protein
MAIARFENININNLTFTKSDFGESATVQALWFATRARVADVANSLKIADKYRLYQDMIHFTLNYTRNTKLIAANQYAYSITYRGQDWRIDSARESDDRMTVMFLCYRSDPVTAV